MHVSPEQIQDLRDLARWCAVFANNKAPYTKVTNETSARAWMLERTKLLALADQLERHNEEVIT